MPNELRFTVPLAMSAITVAAVREARRINDTTKSLELEIGFFADAVQPPTPEPTEENPEPEAPAPVTFTLDNTVVLRIANDGCTRVRLNPYPRNVGDLWLLDTVEIPMAFEQALGAYFQGGNTGLLGKLQQLGLLPAGTAE